MPPTRSGGSSPLLSAATRRTILRAAALPALITTPAWTAHAATAALASPEALVLRYEQWLYREHWRVCEVRGRKPMELLPGGIDPALTAYFGEDGDRPISADPARAACVLRAAGVSVAQPANWDEIAERARLFQPPEAKL